MSDWNPRQYLRFEKERTQPATDLINRIECLSVTNIIDIGCGPGNSTNLLQQRYMHADILGIDNSQNMIEAARSKYPSLKFQCLDAQTELVLLKEKYDIVFSNACIQWIPNHQKLLPELYSLVKKGGVLAVQTPMNFNEPIHNIIKEVAHKKEWKQFFQYERTVYNLKEEEYFDILGDLTDDFEMWKITYFYHMNNYNDYCRTTGLRPYMDQLPEDKKKIFEDEIVEGVKRAYTKQHNGQIISKCPRLFFVARK